jgi:hypothetical protein
MVTAFIHVARAASEEYEARLAVDWDGRIPPGPGAPCVSFNAIPTPPEGYSDWIPFLLETSGPSTEFSRLGCELHDLLIAGDIGQELMQVAGPLRLLIRVDPPELAALPWELMRNAGMLMFTDVSRPVARVAGYFNPALELPKMCWPLRVMLVVASQDEEIHVEDEIRYVTDAFRKVCGLVDLEVCYLPDREGIRKQLEAMQPHVFHFIGHGGKDDEVGGFLRLEQEGGSDIQWTASAIRDDLAFAVKDDPNAGDLAFGVPRLAVLNACQSGQEDEHHGTLAAAQGLAQLRVPAVIAMQGPIRGDAAACFAHGLYERLSAGWSLDRAVTRARVRITDELSQNHRDYALPALILGAPPEHILDLSQCDPSRSAAPLTKVLSFVDRTSKRRQLWDGLWTDKQAGPRIFAITGPGKAGKGSMVRWSLGVASVLGHPTVFAEIPSGDRLDSVGFLDALIDAAMGDAEFSAASAGLRVALARYRYEKEEADHEGRAYAESPLPLYQKLASVLAQVTEQRTLLIGIDGLVAVERGTWLSHAVPGLVGPIARGQAGNVRLVVSLHEDDRKDRFPQQIFDGPRIADVPIKLFPAKRFVELVSQRLRAQGYKRDSFDEFVTMLEKRIKQQDWGTDYFDIFDSSAKAGQFEPEPEP